MKHTGQQTLTLDGVNVVPAGYVGGTTAFNFRMPARNNILYVRGYTRARAAIYGSATILQPLSPGPHTLVKVETFANTSYYTKLTYKLTAG